MAEKKKHPKGLKVPPERWIVHAPFDSAEYLEGEPPRYADPDEGQPGPDADAASDAAEGGGDA